MRRSAILLAALLVLPACTDSKPKKNDGDDAKNAARGRLTVLAQATADGSYDATYSFVQQPSNATGTIRIRQDPPQYRIDVTSKSTASFLSLTTGVVSCTIKLPRGTTCFLVARPGEEVPALFDPGVQRLFRDAVTELAEHPTDYDVTALPATSDSPSAAPSGVPTGECFLVKRTASPATPGAGFEDGTYCFAEQGIATRIEVESGLLTLKSLGGPPHVNWFTPPATVQQLPSLSATPSPK